jgi:class 3 adenylate cyclase/tetratricopeptide (TPR) repeat protein
MASGPRRERKLVSVLFADLVGFTSRSETLDPEDVEAILTPYHAHLRSELERFGGSVEKFIGDAVVAVFGAPLAHEDDAERAVRAALAIRDWAREDESGLQLRIAVNTGEALVSLDADPGSGDHAVAGDVVNTASRLQAAAPVNGVLVGEGTHRATQRAIEYREAAPVDAKGKANPVLVWEAIEARSRLGSDVTHLARAPLVGRSRELGALADALARAREERTPQLVTLVGVPGIGKSRLVYELSQVVDADPEIIRWRQGRCLPYGEGVAFWALSEIVKAEAGILEGDSAVVAHEKLSAAVGEILDSPDDAAWVIEQLRPLFGLAEGTLSGGDTRAEGFAAWRRFFEALADDRALVLVVEDLHWADDGLLDFVDYLVEWAVGVPILLVATARPELLARRPNWGGGKPNSLTLSLTPLSQTDTAQLLHTLLDRAVLPADMQELLLERAGGNPLYAEEFARIADERGVLADAGDLPVPQSLQGLVAARLDALPAAEKALLLDAAVVGKVFWLGAAAALGDRTDAGTLEQPLHALMRKEFVTRERRSAVSGDTQYAFAHALVQEVAYGQLPRGERAAKHRRAAEWIDALGRPEDHAEMRAHHYVRALEAGRAAGQDTARLEPAARLALRDAGDRAVGLNAYAAAAKHYDRALALWPDDDARPRLLLAAAWSRFEGQFFNDAEIEAAGRALLAAGDHEGVAQTAVMLANSAWVHGRGEETVRRLERAAEVAEPLPSSPIKAYVYAQLSRFHMLAGRIEPALRFGREALELAEEHGLEAIRANALNNLGTIRATYGDRAGLEDLERSIAVAEAANSPHVVRAYNNFAYMLFRRGDLRRYDAVVSRMAVAVDRFAFPDWRRWLGDRQIARHYCAGEWDEANAIADRLIAEAAEIGGHYLEGAWRLARSRIRLARGRRADAESDSATALELARAARDPQVLIPGLAWTARIRAPRHDAVVLIRELEERVSGSTEAFPHVWFVDVAQALVAQGRGDEIDRITAQTKGETPWLEAGLALAGGRPAEAAEIFGRMGARPDEAEARLAAGELFAAEGRLAEAETQLAPARAFFEAVGAAPYVERADELLAASA